MRPFLDANILFTAAHNSEGRSRALFELAEHGYCELITSPHAVEEARRNVALKFPEAVERLEKLLRRTALCPESSPDKTEWARTQSLPDKDAPILGAAVQCGAGLLVTGDKTHFGHLYGRQTGSLVVVTPAEALRRVLNEAKE